jgi:hypothetical protein
MIERISVRGVALAGVVLAIVGGAPALAADKGATSEPKATYSPPKTPWGDPDLQGMWPVAHLQGTPFQRPEKYGDRMYLTDEEFAEQDKRQKAFAARYEQEIKDNKMGMGHWAEIGEATRRTSLLIEPKDGQMPGLTELGKERSATMRSSYQDIAWDSPRDFDSWDRCVTRGMPASMFPFMYNNGIQVLQAPGYVVIRLEMVHEARIIPLDGRPVLPSQILQWMGVSRGHWEGSTLVIETTDLQPGPSMLNVGTIGSRSHNDMPVSEKMKIVERLTPTGPNTIDYRITVDDPENYTAPWTADLPWVRDDTYKMFEYACHEGNDMIRNYITSSRAKRVQAAAAKGRAEVAP